MDIYTYILLVGILTSLTFLGLIKRAGIMHILALILGLVATAEEIVDGVLTVPFGSCFQNGTTGTVICGTVNATIGGDMPLLLLGLFVILNVGLLVRAFPS